MSNIHVGDALDICPRVHGLASIVQDPPGGGSFMGLKFDASHGGRDKWIPYWAARFRAGRESTERGAWGLYWSFPRTAHWTACALDDAGWEVVSCIEHIHGQGWPKGRSQLKPAKEIWWLVRWGGVTPLQIDRCRVRRSGPIQSTAGGVTGYGGSEGLYQKGMGREYRDGDAGSWPPDCVLSHSPSCREVGVRKVAGSHSAQGTWNNGLRYRGGGTGSVGASFVGQDGTETIPAFECLAACSCGLASLSPTGGAPSACPGCGEERWWACPVAELDGQSGHLEPSGTAKLGKIQATASSGYGGGLGNGGGRICPADSGGASRFFPTFRYDAKASRHERQAGCEGLLWIRDEQAPIGWRRVTREDFEQAPEADRAKGNVHATIKPVGAGDDDGLMRWLVRLVTPPGGRVGDFTAGSGSTAIAAQIEGHPFEGCDVDPGAVDIARARLAFWTPERHRAELAHATELRRREKVKAAREAGGTDDLGPLFAGMVMP